MLSIFIFKKDYIKSFNSLICSTLNPVTSEISFMPIFLFNMFFSPLKQSYNIVQNTCQMTVFLVFQRKIPFKLTK